MANTSEDLWVRTAVTVQQPLGIVTPPDLSTVSAIASLAPATTLPTVSSLTMITLMDSLTVPTYSWLLLYVPAAAKWFFLGGSPFVQRQEATQTTAAANNVFLDEASGPTFTVPRAGVYLVRFGGTGGGNSSSSTSYHGINVNGTAPSLDTDGTSIIINWNANGASQSEFVTGVLPASAVLKAQYADGDATRRNSVRKRWIEVQPVYVT